MSEIPEAPTADGRARARLSVHLSRLERLLGFELDPQNLPAWLRRTRGEHRVPAALAIIVLIGPASGWRRASSPATSTIPPSCW